ncbi:hypothetical protein [Paraburkholderia sp. BL6665CI2N2]|uniref:hypothetical protein n=1 Tax=Paraburkholderia sp. BL6665CI2N2 TaxID=1938806 RepID=UPI001AB059D7
MDRTAEAAYLTAAFVIAQALAAGCVLAERSETNANALETKDSPHGGSSLPLTYAGGDADRSRYAAICESDRRPCGSSSLDVF